MSSLSQRSRTAAARSNSSAVRLRRPDSTRARSRMSLSRAWSVRLEETVVDSSGPVILVAHSLGCILTAWWAAHSQNTSKVQAALLVAPGDVERPELAAGPLHGWRPIVMRALPFPSILVGSQNDPYCTVERARALAEAWGSRLVDAGARGHINAESGLGDWPEGHALLDSLAQNKTEKD